MQNFFHGIGRLARNAEINETRNGHPMARFTIAIERNNKEATEPDWIPCAIFGDRVQRLAPYLTKGALISVSGRLESYKTSDGHTRLVIAAAHIDFLGRPKNSTPDGTEAGEDADMPTADAEPVST